MIPSRIVLRDAQSGLYCRGPLERVTNPYDALTFRNILEAEEFCRSHSLTHLQLIQQAGYFPRPLRYVKDLDLQANGHKTFAPDLPSAN